MQNENHRPFGLRRADIGAWKRETAFTVFQIAKCAFGSGSHRFCAPGEHPAAPDSSGRGGDYVPTLLRPAESACISSRKIKFVILCEFLVPAVPLPETARCQ